MSGDLSGSFCSELTVSSLALAEALKRQHYPLQMQLTSKNDTAVLLQRKLLVGQTLPLHIWLTSHYIGPLYERLHEMIKRLALNHY